MKTLTIRLPDTLVAEIENESRARRISKSDIVRERIQMKTSSAENGNIRSIIGDLVGSVRGLPAGLSSGKKRYLAEAIRSKKISRRQ